MDTDELMSAVPVPLEPEPSEAGQLEANTHVDDAVATNLGHADAVAATVDADHSVHAQLSDVGDDVDTDDDIVDHSLDPHGHEPHESNGATSTDSDVAMAVTAEDAASSVAAVAADRSPGHAASGSSDVVGVDAAVDQVDAGELGAEKGQGNHEDGVHTGDQDGGADDDNGDHDGDHDADAGADHCGDGGAGTADAMELSAAAADDADADVDVDADPETRRRASSTGSSDNGLGAARSVGRLRVNDKGEPTMMLPSFIWDYFVKEANGKFVVCTLCPNNVTRFAYSGGTSTMNRHLRKKHQKYAPGKTAADYEYPRAAKRALAAAMAHGVAGGHNAAGGGGHSTAVGHAIPPPAAVGTSTAVTAAAVAASMNVIAMSPTVSSSAVPANGHSGHHHAIQQPQPPTAPSQVVADAAAASAMALGVLSPSEATRRQLIDLRNARRRATTAKRRKLIHGMLDTDQYGAAAVVAAPSPGLQQTPTAAAEFDPSGFVTLHTPSAVAVSGLQFPPGFELSDAGAIDAAAVAAAANGAGDVRLFDYATSSLLSCAVANSLQATANPALAGPLYAPRAGGHGGSSRRNPQQHKLLTHRLLKYLIAQYEPLDVSRMGAELAALVSGTDYPSHSSSKFLPSEETLKLALANLYYSQREMLKEVIAEVDVLSLSLNNWKSVFGQNVLTVSGHWISQGFSRRDCVLEVYVLPLDESVNTIALLRDVMDKWDIPANKVAALTMLKNGKEEKAIHEEYPGLTVVNCFVSVLDNAVSAGLMKCAPLIRRCRNYVSYFIQNPSEYQIFLSLQRKVAEANLGLSSDTVGDVGENGDDESVEGKANADGHHSESPKLSPHGANNGNSNGSSGTSASASSLPLPTLSVICDFEDRWNSTSEMICRIVELEQMLMLYKSNLESDTNPNRRPMQLRFVCCELSADEWANLKELARLLEPVEGVVHVATNCEYPGLSIILPLIHSIRKHLDHAELWIATSLVSAVRNAISSALAAAQPLCSCGAMPPSSPYLSCLLDPRFKALPFLDQAERDQLIEMLRVLHVELVDSTGGGDKESSGDHDKKAKAAAAAAALLGHAVAGKKGGILNAFFPLADAQEQTSESEKLKAHVQLYLDSPALPATDDRENDPLDWWSRYVRSFPWLAKLAKKYLCMSAVSVPFYEAFTNYGQLMREKKARLDIEVAAQILFCRSVSRIPEMERMNV